jgi:hypothetical protein
LNLHLSQAERPWIHAFVVFPEGADFGGLHAVQTNPRVILPRGQARVIVFHPTALSAYIGNMNKGLDRELASALVLGLGGKMDGTWMDYAAIPEVHEQQRTRRLRFKIVWEEGR